jgi:hypothetical protein
MDGGNMGAWSMGMTMFMLSALTVLWLVQLTLASWIFWNVDGRGKDRLLWFVLMAIPVVGVVFIITYMTTSTGIVHS